MPRRTKDSRSRLNSIGLGSTRQEAKANMGPHPGGRLRRTRRLLWRIGALFSLQADRRRMCELLTFTDGGFGITVELITRAVLAARLSPYPLVVPLALLAST